MKEQTKLKNSKSAPGVVGGLIFISLVGSTAWAAEQQTKNLSPEEAAIAARIAPVGQVILAEAGGAAPAAGGGDKGKALYTATCAACHGTGVAGAPKVGDKAAWAPRIAQGMDTLNSHAIGGFKAMPPKGGSSASDDDVKAAVSYMVNASK